MPASLASLHIYPVKSLKGIDLSEARATERGLENDRRWMLVDERGDFLTQREHPRMATVWTDLTSEALVLSVPDEDSVSVPLREASGPALRVRVWRSTVDALAVSPAADALLSRYLGMSCRLVYMPEATRRYSNEQYAGPGKLVGFADGYAFLLTSADSLAALNARLAAGGTRAVPMNRFRPNLVVQGAAPFAEDGWKRIRIGSATFGAAKPCGRCQVTTTDQTSGEVLGPEPLATLCAWRGSDEFGAMFGMNLVCLSPGVIRIGDTLVYE